jgi:hypothetical protein
LLDVLYVITASGKGDDLILLLIWLRIKSIPRLTVSSCHASL